MPALASSQVTSSPSRRTEDLVLAANDEGVLVLGAAAPRADEAIAIDRIAISGSMRRETESAMASREVDAEIV